MDKKPIQLTEQDLHMLVEDAVKEYLIQEGFWGGMKNVGQKAGQAISNGFNKVTTAANNMYNNAKLAYQQGSAQQDLQNVNNALQPMVQKGIIGQGAYNQILMMLNKAMRSQGGQNMQGM